MVSVSIRRHKISHHFAAPMASPPVIDVDAASSGDQ